MLLKVMEANAILFALVQNIKWCQILDGNTFAVVCLVTGETKIYGKITHCFL